MSTGSGCASQMPASPVDVEPCGADDERVWFHRQAPLVHGLFPGVAVEDAVPGLRVGRTKRR